MVTLLFLFPGSDATENGGPAFRYFFEHRCTSGYDLVVVNGSADDNDDGDDSEVCLPCSIHSFSPYGIKCADCPAGSNCFLTEEILEGTFVTGSSIPVQVGEQY